MHIYSVYGRRKLWKAARRSGIVAGRDQVARLMRSQGLRGASRAKMHFTTKSDAAHVRAPDLVKRDFTAPGPDALWVADFTYCSTWSGIGYFAFIIDVYSRRLGGWKAASGGWGVGAPTRMFYRKLFSSRYRRDIAGDTGVHQLATAQIGRSRVPRFTPSPSCRRQAPCHRTENEAA